MLTSIKVGAIVGVIAFAAGFLAGKTWESNARDAAQLVAVKAAEKRVRDEYESRLKTEEQADAKFAADNAALETDARTAREEIRHADLRPRPERIIVQSATCPEPVVVDCPVRSQFTPDLVRLRNRAVDLSRAPDPANAGRGGDGGPAAPDGTPR